MLALTLTCIVHLLSVVSLLPMQLISIQAYPITSSPIEWTAENWAWQAWARQTSEEQSKGKARKVTPKSIFEIPYRNGCPPGHHSDGKRCIPTVSIDPSELLNQQVLAFVGDVNTGGNIEFEYEDDVGSAIPTDGLGFQTQFNIYDAPQKFSDEDPTNFDSGPDKLPSQDAPLKFNFFEQNLPNNENETMTFDNMPMEEFDIPAKPAATPSAPPESSNATNDKPANQTLLNSAINANNNDTDGNNHNNNHKNIIQNNTLIESNNTINNDLLSESSNISASVAKTNEQTATNDRTFFLTNIDAISLPAHVSNRPQTKHHNSQRVSIYRGDSALEELSTQKELAELYVADDLLPLGVLKDVTTEVKTVGNLAEKDATDDPLARKGNLDFQGDTADILVNQQKNEEKNDHIRSVSESSLLPLEAQELGFTTTLEPDATTSYQLDETTIIEEANTPTNILKELLLHSTTDNILQEQTAKQVNVEKLKVKPVQNVFTFNVDTDYVMEETTTTATATETTLIEIETSTVPPLPKTPQEQHQSEIINEGVHINVDENRFDYQVDMAHLLDMLLPTSTIATDISEATTIGNMETIMSAFNQDTTTLASSETDASIPAFNHRNHMNILNNNGTTTILQHNDKEESVLQAKADVFVNNDNKINETTNTNATVAHHDAEGEIVFMVVNKQQTDGIANNVMESLTETTTPKTATTLNKENKITERTTASRRWSKVMPIFDISSETTTPTTTATAVENVVDDTTSMLLLKDVQPTTFNVLTLAPITEVVTTKSSSISISEKRKSSSNSRRNSKIIRLDKYPNAAANVNILSEATKQPIKMFKTTTQTTQTPLTITTEEVIETTTTIEKETKNNSSYLDPFWWLPLDWHLDRHEEAEGRPLLLRLWTSVTSDREAKV